MAMILELFTLKSSGVLVQQASPVGFPGRVWGRVTGTMSCCDGDKKKPLKQPKKQAKEMDEIKHSSRNRKRSRNKKS